MSDHFVGQYRLVAVPAMTGTSWPAGGVASRAGQQLDGSGSTRSLHAHQILVSARVTVSESSHVFAHERRTQALLLEYCIQFRVT
jgi:hypothetical protein